MRCFFACNDNEFRAGKDFRARLVGNGKTEYGNDIKLAFNIASMVSLLTFRILASYVACERGKVVMLPDDAKS